MNNDKIQKLIKDNIEELAVKTRQYVYDLPVDCSEFEKERAFTTEDGYNNELTSCGKQQQLIEQCSQAKLDVDDDVLIIGFADELHTICGESDYAMILIKNECLRIIEQIV